MNLNSTPMFGGSNVSSTSNSYQYFTGLTSFTVLGVNPTKEKIEEWKNGKYNLPVDYSIKDMNGLDKKPIDIWLKSTDNNIVEPLRYSISTNDVISSKGNYQFVNAIGEFTYAADEDSLKANAKMDWFTRHPFRKAKTGEEDIYSFMKALMRYSASSTESKFITDAETNNITPVELFNGNLTGLVNFINWCNSNDNKVVCLAAVRKTDKVTAEGGSKTYYNQIIVPKPAFIFQTYNGDVSKRAYNKIKDEMDKGNIITNALFTIDYQHFNEDNCLNKVISNMDNVSNTSNNGGLASFLGN